MAHKSAVSAVLGMQIPVVPSKGGQPAYFRSKHTFATSSRVHALRACIADELHGKTGGGRAGAKGRFTAAAKKCAMGGR